MKHTTQPTDLVQPPMGFGNIYFSNALQFHAPAANCEVSFNNSSARNTEQNASVSDHDALTIPNSSGFNEWCNQWPSVETTHVHGSPGACMDTAEKTLDVNLLQLPAEQSEAQGSPLEPTNKALANVETSGDVLNFLMATPKQQTNVNIIEKGSSVESTKQSPKVHKQNTENSSHPERHQAKRISPKGTPMGTKKNKASTAFQKRSPRTSPTSKKLTHELMRVQQHLTSLNQTLQELPPEKNRKQRIVKDGTEDRQITGNSAQRSHTCATKAHTKPAKTVTRGAKQSTEPEVRKSPQRPARAAKAPRPLGTRETEAKPRPSSASPGAPKPPELSPKRERKVRKEGSKAGAKKAATEGARRRKKSQDPEKAVEKKQRADGREQRKPKAATEAELSRAQKASNSPATQGKTLDAKGIQNLKASEGSFTMCVYKSLDTSIERIGRHSIGKDAASRGSEPDTALVLPVSLKENAKICSDRTLSAQVSSQQVEINLDIEESRDCLMPLQKPLDIKQQNDEEKCNYLPTCHMQIQQAETTSFQQKEALNAQQLRCNVSLLPPVELHESSGPAPDIQISRTNSHSGAEFDACSDVDKRSQVHEESETNIHLHKHSGRDALFSDSPSSTSEDSFSVNTFSSKDSLQLKKTISSEQQLLSDESSTFLKERYQSPSCCVSLGRNVRADSQFHHASISDIYGSASVASANVFSASSTSIKQRPFLRRVHDVIKCRFLNLKTKRKNSCISTATIG